MQTELRIRGLNLAGWIAGSLVLSLVAISTLAAEAKDSAAAPLVQPGQTANSISVTAVGEGIWRVRIGDEAAAVKLSAVLPQAKKDGAGQSLGLAKGGRLEFRDSAGKLLLTQVAASQGKMAGIAVTWESATADSLYGLGAFQDGHFDLRGTTQECYQRNLGDTVPVVVSSSGFGILWDNPAPFTFTAEKGNRFTLKSETAGAGVAYYVLAGPQLKDVIAEYRRLTGDAPMFPKWVFGYHQSKERYASQKELLEVAQEFRQRQIPLDLLIQDWRYWGRHGWNACRFDLAAFPDAKTMIQSLHNQNIHYIVSVWPCFDEGPAGSDVYKAMVAQGYLSPYTSTAVPARYYDVFNPKARQLLWDHVRPGLFDLGVDGWWLDGSEPDLGVRTMSDVNKFGQTVEGPMSLVANAYPFYVVKAMHDGQRSTGSEKRFFTLTRSMYAGSQRLGACYWTGDVLANWDVFAKQIPACLNTCLAGIPYVNTDIGGFWCQYPGGNENPAYRELVTRWVQFGAFCPQMRMHGTDTAREPWRFGNPGEPAYETILSFIKLRYRLLSYTYSNAWRVTREHDTLMRALPLEFPEDPALRSVGDQFMFGPALMVSPVVKSAYGELQSILPAAALLDAAGQSGGLSATYYKTPEFKDQVLRRKEGPIQLKWNKKNQPGVNTDPVVGLGDKEPFSIRWEGFVQTAEAGEYGFIVNGNGYFRLWVNEKQVLERKRKNLMSNGMLAHVQLPANSRIPVKLEYSKKENWEPGYVPTISFSWMHPIGKHSGTPRQVVLPRGTDWYDFWTNRRLAGGQTLELTVPLEIVPLHVRAGSILPFGPELQHTGEKSDKPTELRVYPGTDGQFTLYDDAGDGYGYEKGEHATIPLRWDDKAQTLTIGQRAGTYPGMPQKLSFLVRILQANGAWKDRPVDYAGDAVVVTEGH